MVTMATTQRAIVSCMRREAPNVLSIELRPADESVQFSEVEPGAHIDLHLSRDLIRSYSLVNPGEKERYVVAVLNDAKSRGGSRYVHENLRVGHIIDIGAPRNHFQLYEDAGHSVLLAGGIGITPLLAMFKRLTALKKSVHLIYCGRTRSDAAFLDEIQRIQEAAEVGKSSVTLHFDDEALQAPNLEKLLGGQSSDTHFYCCGPGPMLNAFEAETQKLEYPHAHIERFKAVASDSAALSNAYTVELRRSRKTFDVTAGVPLLDALQSQGVFPELSCREGICGTCETRVISGEVEHRDSILTASERKANKSMMVCVSAGRCGTLVLDL